MVIDDSEDSLDAENVRRDDEALEHVDLSTLDFVIFVLLVPKTVLIEPVVDLGLGVDGITEVARSAGGHPVVRTVGNKKVVGQLLVLSVVVILQDAEVSGAYTVLPIILTVSAVRATATLCK